MTTEESKIQKFKIEQAWKIFYNKTNTNRICVDKLEIEDWQLILIDDYKESDDYLQYLLNGYSKLITVSNVEDYVELIDEIVKRLNSKGKHSIAIITKNFTSLNKKYDLTFLL